MVPLLATGASVERLADVFSLFHFWLAGFAAYLLLRDLEAGAPAALFGAIAWMLSARMVQSAIWPNAVATSALLPLLLLGILRIGRGRRASGVAWASIAGGLILLAGRPQSLLGALPLVAAVSVAAVAGAARRTAWRDLLLAGVLAGALGGPALAPTAALYPQTSRSGGSRTRIETRDPSRPASSTRFFFRWTVRLAGRRPQRTRESRSPLRWPADSFSPCGETELFEPFPTFRAVLSECF